MVVYEEKTVWNVTVVRKNQSVLLYYNVGGGGGSSLFCILHLFPPILHNPLKGGSRCLFNE